MSNAATTTPLVIELTPERIKRVKTDWERIAKEPVSVEAISGAFYGFCSELAALRLYRAYSGAENVNAQYSVNYESWFFRLEPKFT